MVTGLLSVPVPSWSIVSLVLAPSAATVTKSLKLEVALYPINKSLRSIISALVFVFVFPSVKSVIVSLPAFLKP
jgi:hypothetical protein